MGFFNLSSTIPQTVAPVFAPSLLAMGATGSGAGNYAALFGGAAIFAVAEPLSPS